MLIISSHSWKEGKRAHLSQVDLYLCAVHEVIMWQLYAKAYPRVSGHSILHSLRAVWVLIDQVKLARLYGD